MLIITRKAGEIMIGDDVVLHVIDSSAGSVRLGIEAPRSLPIYARRSGARWGDGRSRPMLAPAEMPSRPAA